MVINYYEVQAGLFTTLTFARHRLSPLAVFTSGAYFLHNGDMRVINGRKTKNKKAFSVVLKASP